VILNPVGSIVKFTLASSKIRVRITATEEWAEIAVINLGTGIPDNQHNRVLEPFGQVERANTRERGDAGLSLPISKALVEVHNGLLNLASTVGHGITATVSPPIAHPPFCPARRRLAGGNAIAGSRYRTRSWRCDCKAVASAPISRYRLYLKWLGCPSGDRNRYRTRG